jgi:hypothetical protein
MGEEPTGDGVWLAMEAHRRGKVMLWDRSGRYLWSVVDDGGKAHDGWTDAEPKAWGAIVEVLHWVSRGEAQRVVRSSAPSDPDVVALLSVWLTTSDTVDIENVNDGARPTPPALPRCAARSAPVPVPDSRGRRRGPGPRHIPDIS